MKANNKFRYIKIKAKNIDVKFNDDKLIDINENNNSDILLDAIFNNKRVRRTIDATKETKIDKILSEMKTISKIKEQKFYSKFPKSKLNVKKIKFDNSLENIDLKDICDKIITLNKELLKNKMVVSTESELSFNNIEVEFFAKDFKYDNKEPELEFSIELALKNKTEFTYFEFKEFFRKKDINFDDFKKSILTNIELVKDPVTFDKNFQDYTVVFDPYTLRSIINAFIIQLSSLDSKMKKESFLANTIFDKKMNIYEDPFIDYSPYSCKLDLDFVSTTKKYLIKNGKPINYITNLNDSFKYNKKPTGNNVSGSITNLFLKPGNIYKDKLIAKHSKVILINNLIGIHTTNNKEGSLSLSATGIEYINGKRVKALKDIKLNEKIQDLFKNVEISKETIWVGNYNLPYLLCKRGNKK